MVDSSARPHSNRQNDGRTATDLIDRVGSHPVKLSRAVSRWNKSEREFGALPKLIL
jgi:hypothetical protein